MPDRTLPRHTREAPAEPHFGDSYIVVGLVLVCVLMAVALLWAGMMNEKSTTQPSSQAPVTQPSTQAPATGETKTP